MVKYCTILPFVILSPVNHKLFLITAHMCGFSDFLSFNPSYLNEGSFLVMAVRMNGTPVSDAFCCFRGNPTYNPSGWHVYCIPITAAFKIPADYLKNK